MVLKSSTIATMMALLLAHFFGHAQASVFMPYSMQGKTTASVRGIPTASSLSLGLRKNDLRWGLASRRSFRSNNSGTTAMAIPGNGLAEQVFIGGFSNFLSIYNLVITARILLSWFPQAQGVTLLQPVYAITDPYLNLFRGVIPPLFGLDFSPILAFFLLSALGNATAALGYEMPANMKSSAFLGNRLSFSARNQPLLDMMRRKSSQHDQLTMNY